MPTFKRGVPRPPNAGRKKGSRNKMNLDMRTAFQNLLENQIDKLEGWLDRVARHDPGRALDVIGKLSEYCLPKLGRIEHTGEGGGPIETRALSQLTDEQLLDRIDSLRSGGTGTAAGDSGPKTEPPTAH